MSERLERIVSEVESNLRDSTWTLGDGTVVEAADRDVWLDMDWLAGRLSDLTYVLSQAVPLDEFHPDVLALNEPAVYALRAALVAASPVPEEAQ